MKINLFEGARRIARLLALVGVIVYGIVVFTSSPYVPIWYSVAWPGETPVLLKEPGCADSRTEYRSGVPTRSGKEIHLTMCFVRQVASDGRKLVFYKKMPLEELRVEEEQKELTVKQKRALANARARLALREKSSAASSSAIDLSKVPTEELLAMRQQGELKPKPRGKNTFLGNEDYVPEVTEYTRRTINAFVIPPTDEDWIESQWWSKRWKDIWKATLGLLGGLAFLWGFTWAVGWIVRGFLGIPRGKDQRTPEG